MKRSTRNWSEYNAGLKQRGSLTFWLDQAVIDSWYNATPSGKRGASNDYSDIAIATFVTMKSVYHQAGRQTQGLLESLFELMGVELDVPDHSTVSPGLFHSNWEVDMLDRLSPSTLDIRCLNLPLSKPLATSPMLDGLPDNVISKRFVCPYLP